MLLRGRMARWISDSKNPNGMAIPHTVNGQSLEICVISPRDRNWRLWSVQVHISEGLPAGTSPDLPTAKSDLRAAWESFKSKHVQEQFEAAFRAFQIRNDDRR
jgi:hypothetical protein